MIEGAVAADLDHGGVDVLETVAALGQCDAVGIATHDRLDQPEIAADLGRKKARRILDTKADCVATGNIGCLTQLRHHLREIRGDEAPPIRHTVEILADAYRQEARNR